MPNNRISALRHEYGMNQRELGEKLGVGQTTVSAWEKGKNEPDHETLHKMAQLLNCSIGYLMGYENDEVTRGLSQEEIIRIHEERERAKNDAQFERELRYQQGDLTPEEEAEIIEDAERMEYEKWLQKNPDCYFEAFKVNQICDHLNPEQRKQLLVIASAYENGIRANK